jgi:hypothetical protein
MVPLAFPIVLPVLALSISGTAFSLHASANPIYANDGNLLPALVSYVIVLVTLSAWLFEKVWSDA